MVRSTADRDQSNNMIDDDDDNNNDDNSNGKEDSKDEVSLFRKELAVIYFNTKKRPAPLGIKGSEICIPTKRNINDTSIIDSNLNKRAESKDTVGAPIGQTLQQPFQTIRDAGKQNEMFAKKCFIMHERTSRYNIMHNFFLLFLYALF